jgi:hypothetical protein
VSAAGLVSKVWGCGVGQRAREAASSSLQSVVLLACARATRDHARSEGF